jgi:hypothetical protein
MSRSTPLYAQRILILIHSRLNADILDCQARYLALPTLGWLQYTTEVFNLHMAVRATLKRLHEVRRQIEVRANTCAHSNYLVLIL